MKQLASNYSISGSAVTLTGVNVPLSQILLISDASTGNVLYSMAGPSASSYTQAANSVITLATAPGASDKLTIYYDDGATVTNGPTSVSVSNFPETQPVSGTVTVSNPQTSVSVSNFPATQAVSGTVTANTGLSQPLTDTQLRATAVPVSVASSVEVEVKNDTGNPLPVSGTVSLAGGNATAVKVDGSAVTQPVSASALPLPTGAATAANQSTQITALGHLTDGTQTTKIVNGANTLAIDSLGAATVNNAASQVFNYTGTGVVAINTVLIGPIDCSAIKEISVQCSSIGTGLYYQGQYSNDATNWYTMAYLNGSNISLNTINSTGLVTFNTGSARYFRVIASAAQSAGTTTLIVYGSQQSSPKLYTSIVGNVSVGINSGGNTIGAVLPPTIATLTQTTGTAATGTSTQALAASSASKLLAIQNTATSGTLYIGFGSAATVCTSASFALTAGQGYEFPVIPTQACWLLGSTSGVTYSILSA
jgi:hypothetical protein